MKYQKLYSQNDIQAKTFELGIALNRYKDILFIMNASFLLAADIVRDFNETNKSRIHFWKPGSQTPPEISENSSLAIVDLLYDTGKTRMVCLEAFPKADFFCLVAKNFDVPFILTPLPAPNVFLKGYGLDDENHVRTREKNILYGTQF